jgi:hypothetical protein
LSSLVGLKPPEIHLHAKATSAPPRHTVWLGKTDKEGETKMVVLGLILLLVGIFAKISILTTIGIILLIVGLILNFIPIGGSSRRVW